MLAGGPSSGDANHYGINLVTIAKLTKDADDYAAFIVAPQNTLAGRSELTASLPQLSRAAAILFDQIEDLLPQFSNTPRYEHSSLITTEPAPRSSTAATAPSPRQSLHLRIRLYAKKWKGGTLEFLLFFDEVDELACFEII